MKDNSFENIYIPVSFASSKFSKIVILAANKEYGKALDFINEQMMSSNDIESKNILVLMALQILILEGYNNIASVLLEAIQNNFHTSKTEHLCKETLNLITNHTRQT